MAQLPHIELLPQFSEMGGGAILAARAEALFGLSAAPTQAG
jgi:hypothetical protein